MVSHVKAVAVIQIVMSGLGLLAAFIVLVVFGGLAGAAAMGGAADPDARFAVPFFGGLGSLIAIFIAALSIPGLIGGIGLLKFRPWARILTIVLSCINLLNIPFGTAVGV